MKKLKNNRIFMAVFAINCYLFHHLLYLIAISVLFCLNTLTVKATEIKTYDTVDFSMKGSISITLSDSLEKTYVEGANITIYKVASAFENNNNLAFNYDERLNACKANLEKGNVSNKVLECVINSKVSSLEGTTDKNGIVKFNDLDLGLYLVTQTNEVEGYSKIEHFLIKTPEILDNKWTYNIESTPKIDIIRLFDLTVEKVWNISGESNIPDEVTIELLKEGEVIDTVILKNENDWTYTWIQIEKSDEYSVREINIPEGYTPTYRQDGNKFIVTNTKTLVQTGQNIWIIEILAFLGIIFIVAGLICEKRRNYE